mmetsp:Transcript_13607/g.1216  ORF Transcript_13607/g.1216 Transcript_13607/m.1216 type:complete len:99 (-) Transcript_13607:829-1125(-)
MDNAYNAGINVENVKIQNQNVFQSVLTLLEFYLKIVNVKAIILILYKVKQNVKNVVLNVGNVKIKMIIVKHAVIYQEVILHNVIVPKIIMMIKKQEVV